MSGPQLQTIFQELDYLDDGYNDGLVSHVGLRRIILETPELEAEVGPTFTRALLTRHSALFFKFCCKISETLALHNLTLVILVKWMT